MQTQTSVTSARGDSVRSDSVREVPVRLWDHSYEPEGAQRLSRVIRATLEVNGWSERQLAHLAAERQKQDGARTLVSASTVNRYASGRVIKPQDGAIKAIAPFIYKVVRLTDQEVILDTTQTYEGACAWQELALIATTGYLAGGDSSGVVRSMEPIAVFIQRWMAAQHPPVSWDEFRLIVSQRSRLDDAEIDRLMRIAQGDSIPCDDEDLIWLSAPIRERSGRAYSLSYLIQIRDGIVSPTETNGA